MRLSNHQRDYIDEWLRPLRDAPDWVHVATVWWIACAVFVAVALVALRATGRI